MAAMSRGSGSVTMRRSLSMRLPHPVVLLGGAVLVAALLTWILPAGQYDRRPDTATGRNVVVAGTYHHVDAAPVGPFAAATAIPRGFIAAADVVVLVVMVGSAFGPTNPFQAGIALKLAQLPPLARGGLRFAMLAAGLGVWIALTLRHANRTRTAAKAVDTGVSRAPLDTRHVLIMLIMA